MKAKLTPDPFTPTPSLLVKLGSIAVHADEMNDYKFDYTMDAFKFDCAALQTLLSDSEVKTWIATMSKTACLPVKRNT